MYGTVSLLLCLLFVGLIVEGRKTARDDPKKPDYIPGHYIQIEENDFNCYYEWWHANSDNSRDIYKSHYDKPAQTIQVRLPTYWSEEKGESEIYPIYNEERFILLKGTAVKKGEENFGIYLTADEDFNPITGRAGYVKIKSSGEYSQKNKYAFLCHYWLILNTTHALDTMKLYKNRNGDKDVVVDASLIESIHSIHDSCFRNEILDQLDECFNSGKYCAMDYDGDQPELVISTEHVIAVQNGAQLIMRNLHSNKFEDAHYYVLKYEGEYYYFPTDLKTENDDSIVNRVSIQPVLQRNDLFWKRVPRSLSLRKKVSSLKNVLGLPGSIYISNSNFHIKNMGLGLQRWVR